MKNKLARNIAVLLVAVSGLCFSGCLSSPFYQNDQTIPQFQWGYNNQPAFSFEITDTTALYNLYFIMRHTDAYPFSNIWIWVHTKAPGDTVFNKSRLEIPLAEASGKWEGRGMGEIWEQRMPITRPFSDEDDSKAVYSQRLFRKAGRYEIKFEQNMRVNPLPEVLQVGLRIEKAGHVKNKKP
jgi:gliding motility-associated lipoprotein GldH